jgi:hypothetical protein
VLRRPKHSKIEVVAPKEEEEEEEEEEAIPPYLPIPYPSILSTKSVIKHLFRREGSTEFVHKPFALFNLSVATF